jgi:hypothetical protein
MQIQRWDFFYSEWGVRFIDKKDFYRPLRLTDADGGDNFCHPGFFFSALGALRGTVWAKRL